MYTANRAEATSHSTTAMKPPGLTHWKPCLTFGLAQNKMARIRPMMISSIGHLAMSQTVTAVEPSPSTFPTFCARPPVTTTMTAAATSKIIVTTVTPSRIGAGFPDRPTLGHVVNDVGGTHEGRDVVGRRPQCEHDSSDAQDPRGCMTVLQIGDVAHDDLPHGRRSRLAQVSDERLSGRLTENAEQGDQDKKTREDRLDAEIGQRRRTVLQVVGLIFLQGSPGSREPGPAAQICWVVRHIVASAAARSLRSGHRRSPFLIRRRGGWIPVTRAWQRLRAAHRSGEGSGG